MINHPSLLRSVVISVYTRDQELIRKVAPPNP
jgi:hypothetical protein